MVKEKKKTKVKFTDKESGNIQPTADNLTSEPATANALLEENSPLQEIVKTTSSTCLQRVQHLEQPSVSHMKFLSTLCNSFASRTLLRHLYNAHSSGNDDMTKDDSTINKEFLQDVLLPWIDRVTDCALNVQSSFTEGIVDILFMVYKLGSAEEKTDLLSILCKVRLIFLFSWATLPTAL